MTTARRLVIVGGGFTGALVAIHATKGQLDVTIVEPAAELGRGIAYGTSTPTLLRIRSWSQILGR